MEKWKCTLCEYVYDPVVGDPDNGVVPGTAFEDISDEWICPWCGAPKNVFKKLDAPKTPKTDTTAS